MKALELYYIDYIVIIGLKAKLPKINSVFAASPCWISQLYASPKTTDMLLKTVEIVDKLKPQYWFIDFINGIFKSWVWKMQWVMR